MCTQLVAIYDSISGLLDNIGRMKEHNSKVFQQFDIVMEHLYGVIAENTDNTYGIKLIDWLIQLSTITMMANCSLISCLRDDSHLNWSAFESKFRVAVRVLARINDLTRFSYMLIEEAAMHIAPSH